MSCGDCVALTASHLTMFVRGAQLDFFMRLARRVLVSIVTVWLVCHTVTLTLVQAQLWFGSIGASVAECTCANGADATCPMHHHGSDSNRVPLRGDRRGDRGRKSEPFWQAARRLASAERSPAAHTLQQFAGIVDATRLPPRKSSGCTLAL